MTIYVNPCNFILRCDLLGLLVRRPVQKRLEEIHARFRERLGDTDPDGHERRIVRVLHLAATRNARTSDGPSSLGDVGVTGRGSESKHVTELPCIKLSSSGPESESEKRQRECGAHFGY